MYRIHLLATERSEGKTRWLNNQITKISHELFIRHQGRNNGNLLILVPVIKYAHDEFQHQLKPSGSSFLRNFDGIDNVFRGMRYEAVFIDEYQKMTPQHWCNLRTQLSLSGVEDLYLAGDNDFTIDQLSRDPNDTEHLYRRLTAITDELSVLTKRQER